MPTTYDITTDFPASEDLFILAVKTFAEANGWSTDLFSTTYSTSHNRLHMHKGGCHFELYYGSADYAYLNTCTGYDGSLPAAQPGAAPTFSYVGTAKLAGDKLCLISTPSVLYFGKYRPSVGFCGLACVGTLTEKIGAWTGSGNFKSGYYPASGGHGAPFTYTSSAQGAGGMQLSLNGTWSVVDTAPGNVIGSGTTDGYIPACTPILSTGGLVPIRVVLFYVPAASSANRQPIGMISDVARVGFSSTVYPFGEVLTIGGDSWLILAVGLSTYGMIFKLGA